MQGCRQEERVHLSRVPYLRPTHLRPVDPRDRKYTSFSVLANPVCIDFLKYVY